MRVCTLAEIDRRFCFSFFMRFYSTQLPEAQGQQIRLTEASVIIGLSPPRQRPGCVLGLNLDYAEVSLCAAQVLAMLLCFSGDFRTAYCAIYGVRSLCNERI